MSYEKQKVKALLRVLRVLHQLNQGKVNLYNLQVQFGISERTAQRDIQLLRLAGFDIDTTAPGVYALPGAMRFLDKEGSYGEKYQN